MGEMDERRSALLDQITRLANKLGFELDRLDIVLYTARRGRARINPDVSDLDKVRQEINADTRGPGYWTKEGIDARATAFRALNKPVEDSALMLNELMEVERRKRLETVANEELMKGQSDGTTNDVKTPGGTNG